MISLLLQLNLNISGEASFGSSSGSSTKVMVGGRCASGELSDEDNNSAFLRGGLLRKSPVFIDGIESQQTERKGSMDVHSRVAPGMVEVALALVNYCFYKKNVVYKLFHSFSVKLHLRSVGCLCQSFGCYQLQ